MQSLYFFANPQLLSLIRTYREKSDQKIYGGYSGNVTETNSDEGLNLVTDVKVKPASAADKDFYQDGVIKTEESTGDKVVRTYADGAYHSQDNKDFNEERDITMVLTGLQGKKSRFDLKESEEGIEVTDTRTGETGIAKITKSGKRYGIKIDGKNRYFTEEQIENQKFRKYVSSFSSRERSKRNNVEATVFQLSYFTRNNKIKYRGITKAQAWAYMRCLWINAVRIVNYLGEVCENTFQMDKLSPQTS